MPKRSNQRRLTLIYQAIKDRQSIIDLENETNEKSKRFHYNLDGLTKY
jgi:hypothetical protein